MKFLNFFAKIHILCFSIPFVKWKLLGNKPADMSKTIIAVNHKSYFDGVLVGGLFFKRVVYFMATAGFVTYNAFVRFMLKICGAVSNDGMKGFERLSVILRDGGTVCVFPEGRISRSEEILPFKSGVIALAKASKADILPIYQEGNYGLFKRPSKVVIGEKISCEDIEKALAEGKTLENLAEELRTEILNLKGRTKAQ